MVNIPTDGMKNTAGQIIETMGEPMNFQRRDTTGEWRTASTGIMVHRQSVGSTHMRDVLGIGIDGCYSCFAGSGKDILPGDRTALDGTWYLIKRLLDRGTHQEFLLKKTGEAAS